MPSYEAASGRPIGRRGHDVSLDRLYKQSIRLIII